MAASWIVLTAAGAIVLGRKPATPEERGRAVYAGEGCIHCHSQYVRPLEPDTERWGKASKGITALVGNRRQGPDLATIGARSDAIYLKTHLTNPELIKPGTVMPSYAHLFAPGETRGADLIAYLKSLGAEQPRP